MFSPGSLSRRLRHSIWTLVLALSWVGTSGCASIPGVAPESYHYFASPASTDPWSPKIAGWQVRERRSLKGLPDRTDRIPTRGRDLRSKYDDQRQRHRDSASTPQQVARSLAGWVQDQAPNHYVADGAIDHWATLEDTLSRNGDDCDGLELLAYHALRELGYGDDQVFRAIVYRPDDGQHHMVTLWFETADDPWVIDPTGAMTRGMPRMSEVPGWVPLKVFSEHREFSVKRSVALASSR